MIGGEFDLSAGVAVVTSALCAALLVYQLSLNVWVGVFVSLILALGIGFLNGYLVVRTGIPSFLITLATFFSLRGINLGRHQGHHRHRGLGTTSPNWTGSAPPRSSSPPTSPSAS